MKFALFALTKGALELAEKIRGHFPGSDIYTTQTLKKEGIYSITGKLSDFLPGLFSSYKRFIFIMASGIVVRLIAPLLKDKTVDPAVLVADEKGEFVISLVSGHIGGANRAAREVACAIGARPVITTASDVTGTIAVDQLAIQQGFLIDNMEKAKKITALIVNGAPVFVRSDVPIDIPSCLAACDDEKKAAGIIIISNRVIPEEPVQSVQLIPRTIIAGIGCRKGCSAEKIRLALALSCAMINRRIEGVRKITSCWVKKDEKGILEAASSLQVETDFFSLEALREVEADFPGSDFVKKTLGVGAVAEPSAYLGCQKKGKVLLTKRVFDEVTVALREIEI